MPFCYLVSSDYHSPQTVISYMVQAGLIGLFGLYLVIPGLLGAIGFKYPQKIHRRFRAVNLLLAVSFFAAEVIHLRQSPGIAELDFMRTLADLQMVQYTVISYGMIACVGAFGNSYKTITFRELLRGGGGYRILDVIPPMLSAVYLSLDKSHYGDPGTWQEQAAATCPRSADYSAGLARQDPLGGVQLSCAGVSNLAWVWLFRAYIGIMGVQALYGAVVGAAWVVSGRGAGEPAFQETVRRHVTLFRLPAKVGLCLCIALTACFVLAVWMERACVDTVWGIDDDDEWGVGQVLALSAWAPTALDIVTWMVRCFRKRNGMFTLKQRRHWCYGIVLTDVVF